MSSQFIEVTVGKGAIGRETVLIAISAIQMVKADGDKKCALLIGSKEVSVPGVSYDEFKKKLGVS
jgi:hypothetical protein